MVEILVPIFICVVLPVAIVLIIFLTHMNGDNKRAQVLIKAIEANNNIDTDKLAEALQKPKKSPREVLNGQLLRGCMFSLFGVLFAIIGLCNFASGGEFNSDPVTVPLMAGAVALSIGVSYLIVYFMNRKHVEK